jgi:hypothetical protein
MARTLTKTADLGFSVETFETMLDNDVRGDTRRVKGETLRCAAPDCRRPFTAGRDWSRYCCAACRRRDVEEKRRVGALAAEALLAVREGKHAKRGTFEADAALAARRWIDQLSSEWRAARKARAKAAEAALDASLGHNGGPALDAA